MSTMRPFIALLSSVWITLLAAPPLPAEVQVRVSIKFILGPNGEIPDNPNLNPTFPAAVNLNSEQVFRDNIAFINQMLTRRGESFRLLLRDDAVFTVEGHSDPWFKIPARDKINATALEINAMADKTKWKWHDDSINIYINDSASGVCSIPPSGSILLVGAAAYQELLIHEIGHFLGLHHTHPGDNDGDIDDWGDGDGFSETLEDDPDATMAQINAKYPISPKRSGTT